jgi:hypothetical protein
MASKIAQRIRWLAEALLVPGTARFVSAVSLVMACALAVLVFVKGPSGNPAPGPRLGGDFAQFYAVGLIQNEQGIQRLYDLPLQDIVLHRAVRAMPADEHLPYVYPPFIAPLFRPFARLPYAWAFTLWLAVSGALYALSIGVMLSASKWIPAHDRATIWWLALSFEPFVVECWLAGQISALGCLAISLALWCDRREEPVAAGLAVSILLYKPSLLFLIVPLLLLGRRWRTLAGFGAGTAALAAVSAGVAGLSRCLEFGRLLTIYARLGASGITGFRLTKYVDLTAFLQLLGLERASARFLALIVAVPPLATLAAVWLRASRARIRGRDLAWAAALCWSPVLNIYSPIYDTILAVPGLVLGASALRERSPQGWPLMFRALLALLYVTGALSPWLADGLRFQPLTVGLAAMATYLTWAALLEPVTAAAGGGTAGARP